MGRDSGDGFSESFHANVTPAPLPPMRLLRCPSLKPARSQHSIRTPHIHSSIRCTCRVWIHDDLWLRTTHFTPALRLKLEPGNIDHERLEKAYISIFAAVSEIFSLEPGSRQNLDNRFEGTSENHSETCDIAYHLRSRVSKESMASRNSGPRCETSCKRLLIRSETKDDRLLTGRPSGRTQLHRSLSLCGQTKIPEVYAVTFNCLSF